MSWIWLQERLESDGWTPEQVAEKLALKGENTTMLTDEEMDALNTAGGICAKVMQELDKANTDMETTACVLNSLLAALEKIVMLRTDTVGVNQDGN